MFWKYILSTIVHETIVLAISSIGTVNHLSAVVNVTERTRVRSREMFSARQTKLRRIDERILRGLIVILVVLVAITGGIWRLSGTSAEGPTLEIIAPAEVQVGHPVDISIVVHNASGIGGYQARLLFDSSKAHLSGVDHRANQIANLGRFIQALGPNEFDGGVSFGLYSCPVDECGDIGKPVDRGADGELNLATVSIVPDQPGILTFELSDLRFSDASGTEIAVETDVLSLSVNVVVGQEQK